MAFVEESDQKHMELFLYQAAAQDAQSFADVTLGDSPDFSVQMKLLDVVAATIACLAESDLEIFLGLLKHHTEITITSFQKYFPATHAERETYVETLRRFCILLMAEVEHNRQFIRETHDIALGEEKI